MARKSAKQIGALWLKSAQSEEVGKYFSGTLDLGALGDANIAFFKNSRKEKDSQPDYHIVLSEPAKAEDDEDDPLG